MIFLIEENKLAMYETRDRSTSHLRIIIPNHPHKVQNGQNLRRIYNLLALPTRTLPDYL